MRVVLRSLATSLAAAFLVGCADRELAFEGALLRVVDRLDAAEVEVQAPLPVAGIVDEVHWVRDGRANVTVSLRRDDGVGGEAQGRVLTRWGLPLLPAPPEAGGPDAPELIGVPLARIEAGTGQEAGNGFWLQASQLGIVHPAGHVLPETIRLRYTVYAAQLAGTAEGAGFPRGEVFATRLRLGPSSSEALVLPTGATLTTTLPPVGPGRLGGVFRALAAAGGEQTVAVEITLDGAPLFADDVPVGPIAVPLGATTHPWIELPASKASRELVIAARGSPGGLVALETPIWSRARSWREGPNALLLVASGMRADRMGAIEPGFQTTPELDDLAARSLLFLDAWATSSWTLPSMATILTSTHGSEHLATRHDRRLGRGVTTVAEAFRDAGYRTAAFTDGGFVAPAFGLDRGFDTFDAQGGGAAVVCERASRFLERHGDRPWFLLVQVADLLPPYEPPAEARADVERRHGDEVKDRPPDPAAYRSFALSGKGVPGQAVRYLLELYDEELRATDRVLGRFLDELEERELFRDALIAFTSDHGQEFGEHGFLGYGDSLYPEVLRVPLMLKLPRGQKAGLDLRPPVSLIDLAPTLLDGVELRDRIGAAGFTGTSLIRGGATTPVFAAREHPVAGPLYLLRNDRNVFLQGPMVYHRTPGNELYDVVADPLARRDVLRQQAAVAKVSANRIERHLLDHPPRVEGTESALSARELGALDPLPDARPEPEEGLRGEAPRRGRQPRRNR